jgi:hypothetical protein
MAIKRGELLLQEKLISPEQLDEALKNQTLIIRNKILQT